MLSRAGPHIAACAQAIGSLDELAVLWQLGWLGTARASSRLQAAELRTRVQAIAHARRSLRACVADAGLPPGTVALLQGRVVAVAPSALRLADPDAVGEGLDVLVDEAAVVGAAAVVPGDDVVALGFLDAVISPDGVASSHRGAPTMSVLRAGSTLPLVVITRRVSGNATPGAIL